MKMIQGVSLAERGVLEIIGHHFGFVVKYSSVRFLWEGLKNFKACSCQLNTQFRVPEIIPPCILFISTYGEVEVLLVKGYGTIGYLALLASGELFGHV